MTETVQLREGAYRMDDDGPVLLGGRCAGCGKTYFPRPELCLDCLSSEVNEVELSRRGALFSWSTIHMPGAHFKPPYTIAYVDLPEGVRLFGPIGEGGAEGLRSGQSMRVDVAPLWEEDGASVIAHRFFRAE